MSTFADEISFIATKRRRFMPMTTQAVPTELGTEKTGKLLAKYAIPSIVAMIASSIYNIVDSAYIGHGIGPMALSGLAPTFPLMNISSAFGAMVGVGASTMISVRLGQKDYRSAQHILGNAFIMNIIVGIVLAVVTLSFLDPILLFFGASEATLGYAREYMLWILLGNVFTHLYFGFNAILRSAGHPDKAMKATILTVVLNCILDPLFIFPWGLNLGIRGAAIATIVSQCVSLIWQMRILTDKRELLHLHRGIYRLEGRIVKEILSIGISPCLMNLAACTVVIFMNRALLTYGDDYAVGSFSVVHKVTFVFFTLVMGLNQGMQPIAGYNYGAERYDRVMSVLKLTMLWATAAMTLGWVVCEFMPRAAAFIFTTDEHMTAEIVRGLRINAYLFPLIGSQMVISNFFQAIAKPWKAIFLSLSRQFLFLIPFLLWFPTFWEPPIDGVWYSLPASDLVSSITGFIVMAVQMRSFRKMIKNEQKIS